MFDGFLLATAHKHTHLHTKEGEHTIPEKKLILIEHVRTGTQFTTITRDCYYFVVDEVEVLLNMVTRW